MACPVLRQHHHGRGRPLYPAGNTRDPDFLAAAGRKPDRTGTGIGSDQTSAEVDYSGGAGQDGEMAPAYVYSVFVLTYGTTVLGSSRDLLLSALVASAAMSFFTVPIAGYLSDRIGRKRMYLIGSVATGLFAFIYFALLNTGMPSWIFIAIVLSFVPQHLMYGPQAALIAECFTPRLRYSGASIGYQLCSVIAGGPAPLIATALLAAFGSGYVIAVYILFCAIVSVVATILLPDYTNRDISEEYA